ncbi:uncharacterized protein [Misgurnus anguillicaudatus]|uniref:uncharacterized protein isoform X1 n=1 Tax=Misgurnus anguillicaudatus TaxID=75329 RepID=UPI003CCF37D7
MSHPEREPPAVRPRRQVNLPHYLADYEISVPKPHRQQPYSPSYHDVQDDYPPSTMDHSRSTSPLSQASECSEWILKDQWDSTSERLREENAALKRQVQQIPEITAMLEEMKRENATLQRQASQLPEIFSAVQEMRQQNVALFQEIQSLKSERRTPPESVISPQPFPSSHILAAHIQTPELNHPIPAPRSRMPSAAAKRQLCPTGPDESSELTAHLRNMNISSSSHERHPFTAQYSDSPQFRYQDSLPYSLPPRLSEFMVPSQDQRKSDHTKHSSEHPLPSSTPEKTYRGPTPTIPFLMSPDPREFSRLRIALHNILPDDATEHFKFQILTDHLKLEEALLVADSYSNSKFPFTNTMRALNKMYGQPHQLALQRIAELMDGPNIRSGDVGSFRMFGLQVRSLVSMVQQLGHKGRIELECGSHVSRLLSKLPHDLRSSFKRYIHPLQVAIPTLLDFADWLEYELQVQEDSSQYTCHSKQDSSARIREVKREPKQPRRPTTILLGTEKPSSTFTSSATSKPASVSTEKVKAFCPYCDNNKHYLNSCDNFKLLNKDMKIDWIKTKNRCWRCGRGHQAANCTLKTFCSTCNRKHLLVLHDVNEQVKPPQQSTVNSSAVLYVDRLTSSSKVLLKVIKVLIRNGNRTIEAYAVLDDGSERTIILHDAVEQLGLVGEPEDLVLRTVRQDTQVIHGAAVTFTVSPTVNPNKAYKIRNAFTAKVLGLAEHTHPVSILQRKFKHLAELPLEQLDKVHPVLLIGSDCPHLITPIQPVKLGPPGGPAAVRTRLGWTLQGPTQELSSHLSPEQCFFTSLRPINDLYANVERLWQMDVLPYQSEKVITRSRQDKESIQLLQENTVRVNIDGVQRYATPLLRVKNMPNLYAHKEAVLPHLRGTEKRLERDPNLATAYQEELNKLEKAGYVVKLSEEQVDGTKEAWYIPHHIVQHNGKYRVVFNCSFSYQGHNLNELLLPGPTLGPSLLAVLLRFREHSVAISSDIRGMFHQVRLLPKDKPLLRYIWRDMQKERKPDVYEWQALPFGTTCSPCCASFALQKHVIDHSQPGEDTRISVEKSFYVDNCRQSFASPDTARNLVDKLCSLLTSGGFELRQWASNDPSVISHLPADIQSQNSILWISEGHSDAQESTLGLHWTCHSDTLSYKQRKPDRQVPTMRTIYQILARQYDPLGYLIPFTTRAKVIVQRLWDKRRDWDDPRLPEDLLNSWNHWESELEDLQDIKLPRCYCSKELDCPTSMRQLHIFCDASEKAYGSVAYLRTENPQGKVDVAFVTARSRVAPKKQQSIPRLELCAALTGAQLAKVLKTELTLPLHSITLWSDSTTVLTWLLSDSCRFKVFVGTRVAEIQELTESDTWHYIQSSDNPADAITRGKSLSELIKDIRWNQGPAFLRQTSASWPEMPPLAHITQDSELKKLTFCGLVTSDLSLPDPHKFGTFSDYLKALIESSNNGSPTIATAEDYKEAELTALRQIQEESFPDEVLHLKSAKPLPSSSRLLCLAPELDNSTNLIRVGGRLRQISPLAEDNIHPIVIDPHHPLTKLIIKDYDDRLHHPGPERVFSELRRKYWVIRGRAAIRQHQRQCTECQKWRAKPHPPRMADLPPARLRIHQPVFYSTGIDCFGPYLIKIGRRNEKRWGIIFKCMTTRAVHIDLLTSIDSDSFLMALRRFIARRGKPFEILSDQGTNFKGGERELRETFAALQPDLQVQLASQQIKFTFNPPHAPHFGGCWEREIRSLKTALQVTLGAQTVTEEVLRTVLIEIEGILNAKPIGYTSSDIADPDPVTPNILLMGRRDASLPQVIYQDAKLLSKRRWRHSQVLADHFWMQFIRNYLPSLQTRQKWMSEKDNLQVGETVMIVDQQLPRALWPVGKITQVYPGKDNRVRSAEIKVKDRTYIRPATKIISLPPLPE